MKIYVFKQGPKGQYMELRPNKEKCVYEPTGQSFGGHLYILFGFKGHQKVEVPSNFKSLKNHGVPPEVVDVKNAIRKEAFRLFCEGIFSLAQECEGIILIKVTTDELQNANWVICYDYHLLVKSAK